MIADRIIVMAGFLIMLSGLVFIALQNVKIAQMAADVAALVVKLH
jgi:hypothetical protein